MKDRAHALVRSGRFAAALDAYAALIAHDADDPALRLHQAELLAKLDRFPQSIAAYRTAARLLHAQGHTARARAALKNACAISPTDRELLAELRRLETPSSPAYPAPRLRLVKPPPPVPDEEILDSGDPLDERDEVLESIIVGEDLFAAMPERPQKPEELTALLPPLEPQKPEDLTCLLPPVEPPRRREAPPAPKERAADRARRDREAREEARREEARREEARREEARREEARREEARREEARREEARREAARREEARREEARREEARREEARRDEIRREAARGQGRRSRRDQVQPEFAALLAADLADASQATDSYIPIFDFLDAERAAMEARNRRDDVTASQRPRRANATEARRSSARTSSGRQTPRR